jgi:hypothetical protein
LERNWGYLKEEELLLCVEVSGKKVEGVVLAGLY